MLKNKVKFVLVYRSPLTLSNNDIFEGADKNVLLYESLLHETSFNCFVYQSTIGVLCRDELYFYQSTIGVLCRDELYFK